MGEIMAKVNVVKMNEPEDINEKINTIRENRRATNDETVLDTKISLSVKSLLSVIVAIAVVTSAFLAGRYVFPSGTSLIDLSAAATAGDSLPANSDTKLAADTDSEAAADSESSESADSVETDEEATAADDTAETTEETTEETSEETETVVADNGQVITEGYQNVFLEFSRTPAFEWKGTWGKTTTVYYTLTNNEAGTIAPYQFRLLAEGYDTADFIKTVDVPSLDRSIPSGGIAKHGVDIKLQYSESVTDPTNLRLTLQLLDEDGDLIDAVSQEFNLKE